MKKTILLFAILALALLLAPGISAANATYSLAAISYSPAPASPGKLLTLYATIKNTSNSESGPIAVTIKQEYPFSLSESGKNEAKFTTILPQQSVLATLELPVDKAALNGTYSVDLQVKEGEKIVFGRNISIQVLAQKPQVELVESQENTGKPGDVLETKLLIRNVGSSIAKNIFIGTSEDRTVTSTGVVVERPIKNVGASYVFVEALEPNENKQVSLQLGIDSTAEQKVHVVPIKIRFQDANRADYEVTRYIGIRVQGNAEMDASLAPNAKAKAYPGGKTDISVNLFNRGTAIARNVVVEIVDNPIWEVESEKKVFIGTLDPDDFDSFNLTAKIKPSVQPGNYPITLRFEYKNQDYQSKTEEKTVSLQVLTEQDAKANGQQGSITDWLLPLIVIVIIAYFGYRRFFAKKNSNAKK